MRKINANIWKLANNHITDCGREGVESTLRIAEENCIQTVGAGLDMAQAENRLL